MRAKITIHKGNDFLLKRSALRTENIGNAKHRWMEVTGSGTRFSSEGTSDTFDPAPVTINLQLPLPLVVHRDWLLAGRLSAEQHQATGCSTGTDQMGSQQKSFRRFTRFPSDTPLSEGLPEYKHF